MFRFLTASHVELFSIFSLAIVLACGFVSADTSVHADTIGRSSTWGTQSAQEADDKPDEQQVIELVVGEKKGSSLPSKGSDEYSLDTKENMFVRGAVEQISVDVVVTVHDSDGKKIVEVDGPGRGAEHFQFETKKTGSYKIKVAAFEEETGDYEIVLSHVEPIAKTPSDRVDQLMSQYDNPETPGGVVAVVEKGDISFARAYGSANLTHGIPFEVDTRTNIGSTSKQFTAYAIMLLAKQGKLALDDDIRKHIPELPDLGEVVTLRHAMTHTSGYREFLNTISMTGRRLDRGDWIDRSEIIEIVQRQPELQNSPGAEFNYNNTCFGLLATVVERVGNQPFHVWMKENVFLPLKMSDTFVRANPQTIVKRSSMGYAPDENGGYRQSPDLGGAVGAGGIYTTVGDLAKWVSNFKSGELGGKEIFQQMSTPYKLTNGKSTQYGFGLRMANMNGQPVVQHGGADSAHRSMLMYFPEIDAAVITQSNNAGFNSKMAATIAKIFLAEHFVDKPKAEGDSAKAEFDPKTFDAESFGQFEGKFELDEVPGFIMSFTREKDKFYTQATGQPKLEIVPTGPNRFKLLAVEASVTFNKNDKNKYDSLTLNQNGEHNAKRIKEEPWKPDAKQLAAYSGTFFSTELESFYRIKVEDNSLVIKQRRSPEAVKLNPVKAHEFVAPKMGRSKFKFESGEKGVVSGFTLGNGRTKGVKFTRFKLD